MPGEPSSPPGPRAPLRPADTDAHAERVETDESLSTERRTADGTMEALLVAEEQADRVTDLARDRADAILIQARETADHEQQPATRIAVAADRAQADELLKNERATADQNLRSERDDYAQIMLALLPLEREHTNRDLLTERTRSDAAVSHRDDFLGMVAHDLNNLLSGIILSAHTNATGAPQTEEGQRIVKATNRIHLFAARMRRLIGDLVDVTSISAGTLSIRAERSDARVVVTEALEVFRLLAEEKGIALECEIAEQPLLATLDPDRILQVLANVIANAIRFTPQGGRICTRAGIVANEIHVSVSDTGPGIPEELREAVFERFWQASTPNRRGLGLGLYIARSLVEAHGGRIWVESPSGKGSTFHLTLPASIPGAQPIGVSSLILL
jgi:signal transduction histidine kinase